MAVFMSSFGFHAHLQKMISTTLASLPLKSVVPSRAEAVILQIRDMILSGHFPAGFHLQEVLLAEQLAVSRTPIREALALLAKEGLLEIGPKRGYRVRSFTIEEIVEAYEVRATLEGMACRLLAERGMGENELRRLRRSLEFGTRMLESGMFTERDQDPWLEMNNALHDTIVTASNNSLLISLIKQAQTTPLSSARHVPWYKLDLNNFEMAKGAHREHHEIVNAIINRQSGRAESLMREHIYFAQNLIQQHFKDKKIGFDTVMSLPTA